MLKVLTQSDTGKSGLALQLFEVLNQHEIVYCHWKSNELLAEGLAGETDLDLLVERTSFSPTIAILLNLGFKRAVVRWGPPTPGVVHLYGFDNQTENLIHVHLYAHLLTGESLVKTHVLPCGSVLLDRTEKIGNVRVPTKEAEAALCVLRSFIKHGSLLHTFLHGSGRHHDQPAEFWFAEEGITAEAAFAALHQQFCAIDETLFSECYRALAENHSALRKWWLGLRVRRCLRGCARHTYFGRLAAYSALVCTKLRRIAVGKIKNKALNSGGSVVAFIGGDATGKSTLVAETAKWLGTTFAVRTAHVGKPDSSWMTVPLNFLLPLARHLIPGQRHQAQQAVEAIEQATPNNNSSQNSTTLLYAFRAVSLAWDRARLLRYVQRRAAAGEIVICDRFPSDLAGGTDGPRLKIDKTKRQSWLINQLARYEQKLYTQNPPPDVAIRLHVPIEVAKLRNQQRAKFAKHSDHDLELRHQQVRNWNKTGTKMVYDIDTSASLEATILSVKNSIWESL